MMTSTLFSPLSPVLPARTALACAVALATCTVSWAQQVPDAGRLLQQTTPAPSEPQGARPVITRPEAAALPADSTPVPVRGFVFEGNSVLSSEALAALLQDQIGAATPFGQLRAAVARIDAAYAAKGYFLARAVIARQDVAASNGVLRIRVLEGQLGQIKSNLPPAAAELATQTLAAQGLRPGVVVTQPALERGLLLLGDRLGANTTAGLTPGAAVGSTQIEIQHNSPVSPWTAQLSADNSGNRYSGQTRLLAEASRRDLGTLGDSLGLRTQLASGLRYWALSYSLPLGLDGLRLEPSASQLRYELCCQFAPLQAQGSANQWALGLRYPLVLREQLSVNAELSYSQRRSKDESIAGTTGDKQTQPVLLAVSANSSSALGGQLLQSGRVALTRGRLKQNLAVNPNLPSSYGKLRLDYSATARVGTGSAWLARLGHQAAQDNLDSSEKMSLGGANGVRGWPAGEASGDSGTLITLEWRTALGEATGTDRWQASVFADHGSITQQKNTWLNSLPAGQPNRYSLSSVGLGLSYSHVKNVQVSVQYAKGLGNNPGKSAQGLNSDGRDKSQQLWVNASWGM